MRYLPLVVIGAVAAFASGASAQSINLTGTYRCIQDCRDGYLGSPAFVTQNGDQLNLVTETGESYRAWPDVTAPNTRIWIDARRGRRLFAGRNTDSIRRRQGLAAGLRTTSAARYLAESAGGLDQIVRLSLIIRLSLIR
jgi:hypothetical protein